MSDAQRLKLPPHSKESEMMVLGCMLTSVNALNIAANGLNEQDFYLPEHKIVFHVLKELYRNDKPADLHIVGEELKRQGRLQAAGGVAALTALAQYAGTSAYIEEYVEIVRNKSILRQMVQASQHIEKSALDEPGDVPAALDEAQKMLFQISQASNPNIGVLLQDLLNGVSGTATKPYLEALEEKQERFRTQGPDACNIVGIPSHFIDIDRMLYGFQPSNLTILAARPAMGKTALALGIAENVCFKHNVPVGIFSLEMSAEQLLHRIICSQSGVESDKIRTGALNGSEYQKIYAAVKRMQGHTMIIDDQPGLKITDLRARARRMKEGHNVQLIIVDYLQLLSGSGSARTFENRQNEISEISRMLKGLARELNLPVLCLSQLSRKVEDRTGHRPMMSDLRESGCLSGETLIKEATTGKLYTIKELAERSEQTPIFVYAIDETLKVGVHQMTRIFYSGKKRVYLLKTRTGRKIKASANHPFLKLEGWTRLDQLSPGDRLALPRSFLTSSEAKWNSDELSLLAHLIGDGCILPKQPYHYTSADPINIQTVCQNAKSLFNIEAKLVKQRNWMHAYLSSPTKLTHGKKHPITTWFEKLGIQRVRSYEKRLPDSLFATSKEQTAFFLHHLWATDGNISSKKIPNRLPSAAIYYASASELLSQQVQHLLLNLGIQSTLRSQASHNGYRCMYQVHVQGKENQNKFLQLVGSAGNRGDIVPTLLAQLEEIDPHYNCDVIPAEAWQTIIREAKNQQGLGWRDVCKGLGMSYCGSTLFNSGISRSRMQRLSNVLTDKRIYNLAESDVYWDEITSIEPLGIEDVYDATVPGVHNFVANDIIVHNSIEQDADIVMFLLRREYYDPLDKPGMAELIVAKNRHGGVGSIFLTYRKELAQFANYHPPVNNNAPQAESKEDRFANIGTAPEDLG